MNPKYIILSLTIMLLFSCQPDWVKKAPEYEYAGLSKRVKQLHKKAEEFLYRTIVNQTPLALNAATRIDSLSIDDEQQVVIIDFSRHFSHVPMREQNVVQTYREMKTLQGRKYKNYTLQIRSIGIPIQDLIPNYFRSNIRSYDRGRMEPDMMRPIPLVRELKSWTASEGLNGKNIALWNSHGWYYKHGRERWEWQRPRLFQTVEDLLPTGFVLPYLIPMLENAGAMVFNPRERDIQLNMVVIDNDDPIQDGKAYLETGGEWHTSSHKGFATNQPPYIYENPFQLGTSRLAESSITDSLQIHWIPEIPEKGEYAVYVSYSASDSNVTDAHYTVFHSGGQTRFLVNQQISGNTWIYLGTFHFRQGSSADSGSVLLSNQSADEGLWVSADAVRFGGGVGNIQRNGRTSGRPRFMEAARYNLQFSGILDTLVWSLNSEKDDYKDDYMSRPEYVNYLKGAPYGPNVNRDVKGLGIPVDLSLSFHTDAGITDNDTTIGTLAIYSLVGTDTQTVFPDSVSRLACRDFADIIQTQLVDDIRARFDPAWQRRSLMNALYSETYRPNVPAMILELLSHQNLRDMQFALDPAFRFHTARSMYKGILRYLASSHQFAYTVQPLPVTHFSTEFDSLGSAVLRWQPQPDPLEPSAMPDRYMVYTRIEDNGFDRGRLVMQDSLHIGKLKPGVIYSFKVTALNSGGESFPSEILAVCKMENELAPVLVVNGFDRVSAPAVFKQESLSGFFNAEDEGVPDGYDLGYTGTQNDFVTNSEFRINDAPGHGASDADYETSIIAGNTFDFPFVHGKSIRAAGYSFVSVSDEGVMDTLVRISDYSIMDLILGEERSMPWLDSLAAKKYEAFPTAMQNALKKFTAGGGNLFVSGAHVATDLFAGKDEKHPDVRFGKDILHIGWVSDHAARSGRVFAVRDSNFQLPELKFNSEFNRHIYKVEAPDAIASDKGGWTILRYKENEFSAAAAWSGAYNCLVFGFPFETIIDETHRNLLMKQALKFLEKK